MKTTEPYAVIMFDFFFYNNYSFYDKKIVNLKHFTMNNNNWYKCITVQ